MNVYVDKSYSPKSELGAAEFDKYLQTSDQNTEDEAEFEESEENNSDEFDPKTEV